VKNHKDEDDVYDYGYVAGARMKSERPTGVLEGPGLVESYRAVLKEARRPRVPQAKVMEHLVIQRFIMSPAEYRKSLRALGLDQSKSNQESG
jgi:hypothetical protein